MGLQEQFDQAMMDVYNNALEHCNYKATYFFQMLHERGGLATAKYLITTDTPSTGFTKLWECGRLDLTVEAVALKPEYASLFTEEELELARQRLKDYEHDI